MGYTFRIGEAVMRFDNSNGLESSCEIIVENNKENQIKAVPYLPFAHFCKMSGLNEFFYNDSVGLLRERPGCVPLTYDHLTELNEARLAYFDEGYNELLNWLRSAVEHTLINCQKPAFYNQ